MKRMRRYGALLSVFAVVTLLPACGDDDDAATSEGATEESEPIRIGVHASLTGEHSATSPGGPALEEAIRVINEEGGVAGRPIELVTKDDRSDPARARQLAQEFAREGIELVIGPGASDLSIAALPEYTRNEILTVTIASLSDLNDPEEFPYNFGVAVTQEKRTAVSAAYVAEHRQLEEVAILAGTDAYGTGQTEDYTAAYEAAGVEVVAVEQFNPGDVDMTTQVRRLKDSGAEHMLLVAGGPDVDAAISGITAAEWTGTVEGPASFAFQDWSQYPSEVVDNIVFGWYRAGLRTEDGPVTPEMATILEPVKDEMEPVQLAVSLLQVFAAEVLAAGIDAADEPTAESVKTALETMGDLETFGETFRFSADNHFGCDTECYGMARAGTANDLFQYLVAEGFDPSRS